MAISPAPAPAAPCDGAAEEEGGKAGAPVVTATAPPVTDDAADDATGAPVPLTLVGAGDS